MLLEHHAPSRTLTVVESYKLDPTHGVLSHDALPFICDNLEAIGLRSVRGDLPQAIRSGQPFLAWTSEGADAHMVLVQGVREVEGIPHLIVRDPAPGRGAYLQRVVDFEARLYPNRSRLSYPTIWGER
jgi:hypothetical protein